MVVCIDADMGFFFRINSEGKWQYPVHILKSENEWLKWDSYIECGEPLELDEYTVGTRPPIGAVCAKVIPDIIRAVQRAETLSASDVRTIIKNLGVK